MVPCAVHCTVFQLAVSACLDGSGLVACGQMCAEIGEGTRFPWQINIWAEGHPDWLVVKLHGHKQVVGRVTAPGRLLKYLDCEVCCVVRKLVQQA